MWAGKARDLTKMPHSPAAPPQYVFVFETRMFWITFVQGLPWFCKCVSGAPTENEGEVQE